MTDKPVDNLNKCAYDAMARLRKQVADLRTKREADDGSLFNKGVNAALESVIRLIDGDVADAKTEPVSAEPKCEHGEAKAGWHFNGKGWPLNGNVQCPGPGISPKSLEQRTEQPAPTWGRTDSNISPADGSDEPGISPSAEVAQPNEIVKRSLTEMIASWRRPMRTFNEADNERAHWMDTERFRLADELEAALAAEPPWEAIAHNYANELAALSQQAQPLTDEMIEAEARSRRAPSSGWTTPRVFGFVDGAKWARDQVAALPHAKEREVEALIKKWRGESCNGYGRVGSARSLVYLECADELAALFPNLSGDSKSE